MKYKHKKEIEEKFLGFDVNYKLIQDIKEGKDKFSVYLYSKERVILKEEDLYVCGFYLFIYVMLVDLNYLLSMKNKALVEYLDSPSPAHYRYINSINMTNTYPALTISVVTSNGEIMSRHMDYLYYNQPSGY